MSTKTWTLSELAEATGFEPRTIRSYIQRKILPPPTSLGKHASYTEDHRLLLVAVRYLKEVEGYTRLSDLRGVLEEMSRSQKEQLVRLAKPPAKAPAEDSALEFIQRHKHMLTSKPTFDVRGREVSPRASLFSPHARALLTTRLLLAQAERPPELDHEVWVRIPVADDVYLSVKEEPEDPTRVEHYKALVQLLREQIEGGGHDKT